MKFSDYIQKQEDEFRKAGDGYEALSTTSKACIDSAVQRYVDEYAAKQQAISFGVYLMSADIDNPDLKLKEVYGNAYNAFIEQQNKPQ